jgi:muconolactone delta-isomerase
LEYLVTMTTHVPDGTPDEAVSDVRSREAGRSRELAAQGHLLRLWRPPLQPGEWRTLGLFAADSQDQLQDVLTSMPLHIWRTDEVTPLAEHPNDPAVTGVKPDEAGTGGQPELLTTFHVAIPAGTPAPAIEDAHASEASRTRELTRQGHLLRLWKLPGEQRALGLWRARDPAEMQAILTSLPLDPWMTVQTTPLTPHPSDPAAETG